MTPISSVPHGVGASHTDDDAAIPYAFSMSVAITWRRSFRLWRIYLLEAVGGFEVPRLRQAGAQVVSAHFRFPLLT